MKYAHIISRFLYAVYNNSHQSWNSILPYISDSFRQRLFAPELTEELLIYSIKKLYDEFKLEDALILRFMYEFRLTPSEIYLLNTESFTDSESLIFIKEENTNVKTIKVSQTLRNDIKFYIIYRKLTGNEIVLCSRITQNGVALNWKFIFTQKPKTIYNHFNSRFGGTLPWFNFTPRAIVTLSKNNYKKSEPKLHNV